MKDFSLFDQTVEAFRCLPGVGSKTAQRMLLHLLERDRSRGEILVRLLGESLEKIKKCVLCRNISEGLSKEDFVRGEHYEIMMVPNIVNITYGRGVGYVFEEETLQ